MTTFISTIPRAIPPEPARPPYSGPLTTCPKCRNVGADTEWQPCHVTLTRWGRLHDQPGHETAEPGWLLRTCARCRYVWDEATEDARVGA